MTLYCPACGFLHSRPGACHCGAAVAPTDRTPPDPQLVVARFQRRRLAVLLALPPTIMCALMLGILLSSPRLKSLLLPSPVYVTIAEVALFAMMLGIVALPLALYNCPVCGDMIIKREETGSPDPRYKHRYVSLWNPKECPRCNVRLR